MKTCKKFLLFLMAAFLVGGCSKKGQDVSNSVSSAIADEKDYEINKEKANGHENEVRSYLSGEWVPAGTNDVRPVAVMFNNIKQGVPQSGIGEAKVVYEAPVEGGITRLLGIFENYEKIEKIGSVRSCRNYYVYMAMEFDAFYVHCGQAAYALELLGREAVNNLGTLNGEGNILFFRTEDRVAPHNTYTSGERINQGIQDLGYDRAHSKSYKGHYQFNTNDSAQIQLNGEGAKKVSLGYAHNEPWFEYKAEDGLYYRYQFDGPQVDDVTGNQLAYKNVILQYCPYSYFDEAYLNIDTQSGGSGKYITNGKAEDITWKKETEFGPTRYYDANGKEITLNVGKTWVCMLQEDSLDRVEISAE